MVHKKSTRLMILLAIMGALVLLIAQLGAAFALPVPFVFVSTNTAGTVDGVDFGPEDILGFAGDWFMYFDGSDYELEQGKHDIEALSIPGDPFSDTREIYLSFYQNKVMVDGLGQVMGQDVIKFTETISVGYSYERYFDGSDVGLSTVSEKIDGLEVLPFEYDGCAAVLLISTLGEYSIPAAFTFEGDKLKGEGSDTLFFCATNVGPSNDTAGFFGFYVVGSVLGMPKNYTDSISGQCLFDVIWFTTPGAFAVDDAFGGHSEVYGGDPGDFFGPVFSAPDEGLTAFVDGLQFNTCDD
jgi:hypothetical protein